MENGPASKPAAAGPVSASLTYVDRPELAETYADSVNLVSFDGQSLRIEFGISRIDEIKPNTPVTGRRYPAARLVLSPAAAVDLMNRLRHASDALVQAGFVKMAPSASAPRGGTEAKS